MPGRYAARGSARVLLPLVAGLIVFGVERLIAHRSPALERFWLISHPPVAAGPSTYETFVDLTPVEFTLTVNWNKLQVSASAEHLASNPMFWRNMHFDDWDRLPPAVRDLALGRMMTQHRVVLAGPPAWACLDAADWDMIPQPLRAVTFPRMVAYWARFYGLTEIFRLDPDGVVATLNAVMMAESWFEHRGINVNQWGNRDLGLGGCSNRCRRVLRQMWDDGDLDFWVREEDYYNPWFSTRALVVWFGLELIRAQGDLDLAVRAYHRGFEAAAKGEGQAYLANVVRLRTRYFSGRLTSPTWLALVAWAGDAPCPPGARCR